jgi:hypothetical protein
MSHVAAFPEDEAVASGGRREISRLIEDRYGPADLAAIRVFENVGGHVVDLDCRAGSSRAFAGKGTSMASHSRRAMAPAQHIG